LDSEEADVERVKAAIKRLTRESGGQDLLEYGLLAALIAVVVVAAIRTVGETILSVFWSGIGQAI